jgi:glycogen phosphorylase
MLLAHGDYYMHLADLTPYAQAQATVGSLYQDTDSWARKAVTNVGCSGKFSSDRTIAEYASEIWKAKAVPVK